MNIMYFVKLKTSQSFKILNSILLISSFHLLFKADVCNTTEARLYLFSFRKYRYNTIQRTFPMILKRKITLRSQFFFWICGYTLSYPLTIFPLWRYVWLNIMIKNHRYIFFPVLRIFTLLQSFCRKLIVLLLTLRK